MRWSVDASIYSSVRSVRHAICYSNPAGWEQAVEGVGETVWPETHSYLAGNSFSYLFTPSASPSVKNGGCCDPRMQQQRVSSSSTRVERLAFQRHLGGEKQLNRIVCFLTPGVLKPVQKNLLSHKDLSIPNTGRKMSPMTAPRPIAPSSYKG